MGMASREFICTECGCEQESLYNPCDQCGAVANEIVELPVEDNKELDTLAEQYGVGRKEAAEPTFEVVSNPKSVEDILDDMKRQARNKRKARRRALRRKGFNI